MALKGQMIAGGQTVGVIIPMYNAEETIGETLFSVCRQTYANLDIVVVDDGSTDDCARVVQMWAEKDSRVRLMRQQNAGVAAARNKGASMTSAPILAFLDADDLWAPEKVEAQLQALFECNNAEALIWCWYVEIDENSVPSNPKRLNPGKGEPLRMLSRFFEFGNGSSMLMPRHLFEESGGFDASLRDRGSQGCEDYAFALEVASRFPIDVVKRHLVGYRLSDKSMSTDTFKMWRSWDLVTSSFLAKHPEYKAEIDKHRDVMQLGWFFRSLQIRSYRNALKFYRMLRGRETLSNATVIHQASRSIVRDLLAKATFGVARRRPKNKMQGRYLDLSW